MSLSPPPNFEASASGRNQPLSAGAHLAVLRKDASYLFGVYQASNLPQLVRQWPYDYWNGLENTGSEVVIWRGYVLKNADMLHYIVDVNRDTSVTAWLRIEYDEISYTHTDVNSEPNPYVEGYIDISSLTDGHFYKVSIVAQKTGIGTTTFKPRVVEEYQDEGYTSMAGFTSGTTPGVSDWQALSDNEDAVKTALSTQAIPVMGMQHVAADGGIPDMFVGYIEHRHKFLSYELEVIGPYWDGVTNVTVSYAGNVIKTHTATQGNVETYTEVVDISGLNIQVGTIYEIVFNYDYTCDPDLVHGAKLKWLREQPSVTETPDGWLSMSEISANTTINGDGDVKIIRDNIEWLTQKVVYRNRVAPVLDFTGVMYAVFWRLHPWLAYLSQQDDDARPRLEVWRGEWVERTLPKGDDGQWLYFDLTSAGIWPGQKYRVFDVIAAAEIENAKS